jgi:hypothetical protein
MPSLHFSERTDMMPMTNNQGKMKTKKKKQESSTQTNA